MVPAKGFEIDEKVFPSLGLLRVAAAMRLHGHDVDVLDLSGVHYPELAVLTHIIQNRSDVYGITATMPQMPAAFSIASLLHLNHPKARVILGGPHPTLMQASSRLEKQPGRSARAMQELLDVFDCVVAGDGEKAGLLALDPNAPKLIDGDDPKSPLFLKGEDLDAAPLPARDLIDIMGYHYQIDGLPTMSLIAQLGCPFKCTFCGGRRSPFLRKVRTRSTESVVAEMEHLYTTYRCRAFMFLDDELNVNKQFMGLLDEIVKLQERLGTTFVLRGLLKSELLTQPMADAMYKAGFRRLLIGFESGDERILTNIQKNATVAQNTRCFEIADKAGIKIKALMSLGHAGESSKSIDNSYKWLQQMKPDDFDATVITVYPATPYYDDAIEEAPGVWVYTAPQTGDRLYHREIDQKVDVPFYKGIPEHYEAFVWTDHMTSSDLVKCRDQFERELRAELKIPYPTAAAALQYEHSMGLR